MQTYRYQVIKYIFFKFLLRFSCPGGTSGQYIFIQKHDEYLHVNYISVLVNEKCTLCHKSIPLTISGQSSVHGGDHSRWGSSLALTELSCGQSGYWHSAHDDPNPWISFKMSQSHEVAVVKVVDRYNYYYDQFKNVEVSVGTTSEINDSGRKSCGIQSFHDRTTYE